MKRKKNRIAAILFDFGDTLASLTPSRYDIFREVVSSSGLPLSDKVVKEAYHTVDVHNRYSSLTIKTAKAKALFYERYNEGLFMALGISSYFQKLYPRLRAAFKVKKHWKLIRDVRHVLCGLNRHGITLAIAANWDDNLETLVRRIGIRGFFSTIVSSQEAGFEKPDPALFKIVIKKLQISEGYSDILYVGNDYELDVMGSRAAGCVPVLIDKENYYPFADCEHFTTLREWFDSLRLENKPVNR